LAKQKAVICPYCGHVQHVGDGCRACGGRFDAESRRATRAEMGAWFIRDPAKPFRPGCSHETIRRLVARGKVTKYTILRGPSTRQFWTVARRVPGVAHLLGYCHACDVPVRPEDRACPKCRAAFDVDTERDRLGIESEGPPEAMEEGFSIADLLRPETLRAPGSGSGSGSSSATRSALGSVRGEAEPISAFIDHDLPAEWDEPGAPRRSPAPSHRVEPSEPGPGKEGDRIGRVTLDALDQSLRRTVARQRRTIRGLIAIAALLAFTLAAGSWWAFVAGRGAIEQVLQTDPAASTAGAMPDDRPADAPRFEPEDADREAEQSRSGDVDGGGDADIQALAAALDAFDLDAFDSIDVARAHLVALQARLDALDAADDRDELMRGRLDELRERLVDAFAALELRSFLEDPM